MVYCTNDDQRLFVLGYAKFCQVTIPAFDLLANVAIRPESPSEIIGYIRTNNCLRQSYHVNGSLRNTKWGLCYPVKTLCSRNWRINWKICKVWRKLIWVSICKFLLYTGFVTCLRGVELFHDQHYCFQWFMSLRFGKVEELMKLKAETSIVSGYEPNWKFLIFFTKSLLFLPSKT